MALGAEVEAEKTTGAQEDGSAPLEPNHDQLSPSYIAAISAVPAPVPDQASSGDAQGSRYSRHRGIFPGLVLIKTVEQPMAYGRNFKWLITFLVSGAAAIDPISSTIFYPALPELTTDLHTSPTIANLTVALSQVSTAIFPLWWSFLSESLGRRTVYILSMTLYLVFNILSARSSSIGMLIVMRILSSGSACSVTVVGAGTVSDIWEVKERGSAMSIYYLGPLLGPALGPVIGGALAQRWDWRATQWFLTIYGALFLVAILFFLPETLRHRKEIMDRTDKEESTADNQAKHLPQSRLKKGTTLVMKAVVDPLRILVYLRFPAILMTVYFASITFGIIGIWAISIQQTFSSPPYGYSALIVGLMYLPFSVGLILGSILGGKWSDYIMAREARSAGRYNDAGVLVPRPEDRMRENAWLSIVFFPGALVWYGWTAEKSLLWVVPMIATFFIGAGSMLIFGMVTTMLTEFVPHKSASVVALNSLGRNMFSCIGGVVAQPLISAIGTGWLFTGLGIIATASSLVIWALRRFGPRWRDSLDAKLNIS